MSKTGGAVWREPAAGPGRQTMSGAMRRIGEYLGLLEDTGRYDDEYAQMDDPRYDDTYEGHRYPDETSPVAAERPSTTAAAVARRQ
jgi:cell division inhibitor SepF